LGYATSNRSFFAIHQDAFRYLHTMPAWLVVTVRHRPSRWSIDLVSLRFSPRDLFGIRVQNRESDVERRK